MTILRDGYFPKGRNVSEIVEMTGLSEDVVSALSGDSALIAM